MAAPIVGVGLAQSGGIAKAAPIAKGTEGGGSSFADLIRGVASQALDASKAGEASSIGAISKTTGVVDVVTAVTNAEIALETAIAVRDRVISAYQEIIRMPI